MTVIFGIVVLTLAAFVTKAVVELLAPEQVAGEWSDQVVACVYAISFMYTVALSIVFVIHYSQMVTQMRQSKAGGT
ncbi:hypothetical protein DFJ73DRAFT_873630 [Zopfochytrium polystomum]|nr:hypothetical protein DFJ73DRAFT_873630 [Zopfochytrium polystomum]